MDGGISSMGKHWIRYGLGQVSQSPEGSREAKK
jgi:hypothetical protein